MSNDTLETPTPMTDSEQFWLQSFDEAFVDADFARKLERKLAATTSQLESVQAELERVKEELLNPIG